jgi:putative endonuclease
VKQFFVTLADDILVLKKTVKTAKRTVGDIGEEIATKFLVKHGFCILERNYLKKFGEIDIICEKDEKIHFVEVKTVSRETSDGYRAEDNIHAAKLKRIGRTIDVYLSEKNVTEDWEFHVIIVLLDKESKIATVRFLQDLII